MEVVITESRFLDLIQRVLHPEEFKSIKLGTSLILVNKEVHGNSFRYYTNEVTLEYFEFLTRSCLLRFKEIDGGRSYPNMMNPRGIMLVNNPVNPIERYVILK